jgi:large subunit ribosomal protein L18
MAKLSLFERRRRRVRTALKARSVAVRAFRCTVRAAHLCPDHRRCRKGRTVAAASTLDKDVQGKSGPNVDAAAKVGKRIAEAAKKAGVTPSCSIAAVSCSMAASRRWPMLRAKAGWSSDDG